MKKEAKLILTDLKKKYPKHEFKLSCSKTECIIDIDSKRIYFSDKYDNLLVELMEKYAWSKNVYNIFFRYYDKE